MDKHWLVRPASVRLLWRLFIAVLALTVVAELFISHHAYFGIDGTFAFNAWFGFIACAVLILFAKGLGVFIKRPDDYYEGRDD